MRQKLDESIDLGSKPELFGEQRTPGIVCVQADRKGSLTVYRRNGELSTTEVEGFRPFLWLEDTDVLERTKVPHQLQKLDGSNPYRYLLSTDSWSNLKEISDHIANVSGRYPGHPDSPQLFLSDLPTQYLLATGQTYYNQMAIEELKVLALRVYTAADCPESAHRQDPDRIVAVAFAEGLDGPVHVIDDPEEDKLLWHARGTIKKLDPDLLIGHDLFNRDLELLKTRSKAHKVKQDWGRSETTAGGRNTRMMVAEKQLDYKRWTVPGRELADSWILAVLHDVSSRELLSYDLEDVAAHFGFSAGKPGQPTAERAERDLKAITGLHRNLLYPYFLQAQIFPLSFENVILRGNATRINHLFLREYYRRGHSISKKPEVENFAGGLTAQEHEGCAYGVYHCDVASLYPSLIVSYQLGPKHDELHIFTGLLETLRDFRLLAKARQRQADEPTEKAFFQNLQTTFKILINSFYGYLGFGQGHFGDFERAAEVTRRGRELLSHMMDWLKDRGARILEVDTDGIYFVPSEQFADPAWVDELDSTLASGVQVEFDGRYQGMYCHKMKNYALLEEDGKLTMRGSGLRSRATEPYLRHFIEELIRTALQHGAESLEDVLAAYQDRLKNNEIPIEDLVKTETLIDSPATYAKKTSAGGRNRAAVYELALVAERQYRAGESLSYYITGDKATVTAYDHAKRLEDWNSNEPDYNLKYYLKKLQATYKKFAPILGKTPLFSPIPFDQLPAATA